MIAEGHAGHSLARWLVVTALWALAAITLGGCIASNLAEVIEKLGDNPATVCVTINSIYATGKAQRTNVTKGKVKCDMDGMSVDTSGK